MKIKVVTILLAVVCVGLAVAFFATKKQSEDLHQQDVSSIVDFSNQLINAEGKITDLNQVNLTYSNDLTSSQQQLTLSKGELAQLSNSLAAANATLASTKTVLSSTKSSLSQTREQISGLNLRIADLESQNKVLDQRVTELTNNLAQLNAQIDDTRAQLALAQTNNAYLQGELQKQLAQKAELEHKFNDLDELRAQIHKVRDEMFVARRLQLMKNDNGNGTKKGAEVLNPRTVTVSPVGPTPKLPANYDLNVEIGSDGSVKVIPPMGGATNSAAH
jgi:chromosome segregation ATPase